MPPDGIRVAGAPARPWVLVAGAFLKTGAQDRANYALASFLAQRGDSVHVVAHSVGDTLQGATLSRHIARRPIRSDLLGEPFLSRLGRRTASGLQREAPHVVINGGNCNWNDVNWVHYVHAAYDRPLDGGMARRVRMRLAHRRWLAAERRAFLNARLLIANSKRTMRDLMEKVGVPAERIRVIYCGIDPERFRQPDVGERDDTRQRLGWPLDRQIALFIGALGDRRKGFDTVVNAWETLRRRARRAPLLMVVGSGSLLNEWQRGVTASGLHDSIRFLGFRNDIPQIVRAADLLVAPTRYESYGLGVHEALCCGIPAIVSADAGVAERYPRELQHLLLDDPNDAEELADRIEALGSDRTRGAQALELFGSTLRAYTWNDMARDIANAVSE